MNAQPGTPGSERGAVEALAEHASFGWDGVECHRCRCGEALTPSGASWMNAEPRWLAHLSRVLPPGECPCGHDIDHHGGFVNAAGCLDCPCARKPSEIPVLAADREPGLREAVEAACAKAELLTQDAMGHRSEHWRGPDYADGLDQGIEVAVGLVRDALGGTR